MKTWLKTLFAVVLALTCMFVYVACDNSGAQQTPDNNQTDNKNDDNTSVIQPEIPEDSYRIKFVYSYTAQTKNDNDRTQNVKEIVTVCTKYVTYEEAAKGWTNELIALKDSLSYHGYKFANWYAGWDNTAKPQVPTGEAYAFDSTPITSDIVLYAYRGDLAGDNIVWDIEYFYETTDAVLDDNKDNKPVVEFVYRTVDDNVVTNVTVEKLLYNGAWDTAAINAITYNGGRFTAWKDAEGNVYDFATAAPTEDIVLYGEYFDPKVVPVVGEAAPEGFVRVELVYQDADKQVTIAKFDVSTTAGWTPEQLEIVNALAYKGKAFDSWTVVVDSEDEVAPVSDVVADEGENNDGETNEDTVETPAYDFSIPTKNIVLIGNLSELDATAVVTDKEEKGAVLTLTGHGAIYDFEKADEIDVPWYSHRKSITEVKLIDTDDVSEAKKVITKIGNNSFTGFSKLATVDFGYVTEIGAEAFRGISSRAFKVLRIPATVKTIGQYAFAETEIQQVYFEEDTIKVGDVDTKIGTETISDYAFFAAKKLKFVVVPSTLKTVGANAFSPGNGAKSHTLSKLYYMGTDKTDITGEGVADKDLKIKIDKNGNDWFCNPNFITIYTYLSEAQAEADGKTAKDKQTNWHWRDDEADTYAIQYSFALKYEYKGVIVATDYVETAVEKDKDGNDVFDSDGNIKLQGIINDANVEFRNNLTYNGHRFITYTDDTEKSPFQAGSTIPEDTSVGCDRYQSKTIGGDSYRTGELGGGIKWEYNTVTGVLTVKAAADDAVMHPNKDLNEQLNHTWDFTVSADATSLWTGNSLEGSKVKSIIIEDGVKYIGQYVFAGLISVSEVVIPASLEEIDSKAFDACASLLSVYYMGDSYKQPETENGVTVLKDKVGFDSLTAKSAVTFVKSEVANANDGAYWMQIGNKKIAWKLSTVVNGETTSRDLYVGGDVEMVDFVTPNDAPWFAANANIASLTVASNITKLGANMASGYSKLYDISLPEHLRVIPATAFAGTGIVNDVSNYTKGMLVINRHLIKVNPAMYRAQANAADNKTMFATNSDIFTIAGGAFARCETLTDLFISNTVKYINADAFDDASQVKNIFVNLEADSATGKPASWDGIVKDIAFNEQRIFFAKEYTEITLERDGKDTFFVLGYAGNADVCHHVYTEFAPNTDATCNAAATEKRVCIFCVEIENENERVSGWEDIRTVGEALPHTWGEYKHNGDQTCYSYGTKTAECTTCPADAKAKDTKDATADDVQLLPHKFEEYVFDNNATKCSYGTETAACTTCPADKAAKDTKLITTGEGVLEAHTYGEFVHNNNQTCTSYGTKTAKCTTCPVGHEHEKTEDATAEDGVSLLDHEYVQEVVDTKYAVDGQDDTYYMSCECGKSSDDAEKVFTVNDETNDQQTAE